MRKNSATGINRRVFACAIAAAVWLALYSNSNGALQAKSGSKEARCLALTMYWESRSDGRKAMVAVGWVVLNRRADPDFPDTDLRSRAGGRRKSPLPVFLLV
jgi:hypothetical protein